MEDTMARARACIGAIPAISWHCVVVAERAAVESGVRNEEQDCLRRSSAQSPWRSSRLPPQKPTVHTCVAVGHTTSCVFYSAPQ